MKIRLLFLSLVLLLMPAGALAQVPPPVSLPIQNLPQETQVWCWAAVAQQIIAATRGPFNTPPQCALVATANNAPPGACCASTGFGVMPGTMNPGCVRTGALEQIQLLIARFGGHWSRQAPPTDPLTLYQSLASGHAIILQVRSGMTSAHVIVLRGMSFVPNGMGGVMPVLHVNDPMSVFTQPVPYAQILSSWLSAIVVDTGHSFAGNGPMPVAPPPFSSVPAPPPVARESGRTRFRVTLVEGLGDQAIARGNICSIVVTPPVRGSQCRVRITCGETVLFGGGSGGYVNCSSPDDNLLNDDSTTIEDRDPAFSLDREAGTVEVRDDTSGTHGEYRVVGRIN